jgi:hypothetical protein
VALLAVGHLTRRPALGPVLVRVAVGAVPAIDPLCDLVADLPSDLRPPLVLLVGRRAQPLVTVLVLGLVHRIGAAAALGVSATGIRRLLTPARAAVLQLVGSVAALGLLGHTGAAGPLAVREAGRRLPALTPAVALLPLAPVIRIAVLGLAGRPGGAIILTVRGAGTLSLLRVPRAAALLLLLGPVTRIAVLGDLGTVGRTAAVPRARIPRLPTVIRAAAIPLVGSFVCIAVPGAGSRVPSAVPLCVL